MSDSQSRGIIDHGGRLTLAFDGGQVFSDYRRAGDVLDLTHVEADPALRNTGAAGRFMAALVDWARAEGVKLRPVCGYAVLWFARRPDAGDVLA
jgi:predicted GNAT family acetyltransferase